MICALLFYSAMRNFVFKVFHALPSAIQFVSDLVVTQKSRTRKQSQQVIESKRILSRVIIEWE